MNTVDRRCGASGIGVIVKVGRALRSRAFSVAILAVVCTAIVVYVSLNMNAVTIVDGDSSRVVLTMHNDPYKALSGAGVELEEGDSVIARADDLVEVSRVPEYAVQVTADGTTAFMKLKEGATVADAVAQAGVRVGQFDKLNVAREASVTHGLHIQVSRVQYREFTKTESIPYETETLYTNTIPKGKSQMRQQGQNGVKTYTYRECMENGKVVGTELVKEEVTKQPVKASKLVGTVTGTPTSAAPFAIQLDEAGQPVNFKQKFTGQATAYTSDKGDSGAWTSWAGRARVGVVAVDPKKIPYGTKLYIVSADGSIVYGYAIAGDTGGALRSGKVLVDLFYNTYEECTRFGRRTMNVYIIE